MRLGKLMNTITEFVCVGEIVSMRNPSGRGGELGGNLGTGVRASILKLTPIIYLAFEKYDQFGYT